MLYVNGQWVCAQQIATSNIRVTTIKAGTPVRRPLNDGSWHPDRQLVRAMRRRKLRYWFAMIVSQII